MELTRHLPVMDRPIARKGFWRRHRLALLFCAVSGSLLAGVYAYGKNSALQVDSASITVAPITRGEFQEYIALFGTAKPRDIVFLDTQEGGRVRQVHKRPGELVRAGDLVMELSNTIIEMDVMQRQTAMSEQLTVLNTQQLQLDQQNIELNVDLIRSRHRTEALDAQTGRRGRLAAAGAISIEDQETLSANLAESRLLTKLYEDQLTSQSAARSALFNDIARTRQRLHQNITALAKVLDALKIVAQVPGMLDMTRLEVGESVAANQKLGRIYSPDAFDIQIQADEIHASRVSDAQLGTATVDGVVHKLQVTKVYPGVQAGTFPIDMKFVDSTPAKLKSGQRIEIRLELGEPGHVVRAPVGAFYNDTGGRWIYVLNPDRTVATKMPISLGRKNPDFYEVLAGVSPGMEVITSGYAAFGAASKITLLPAGRN